MLLKCCTQYASKFGKLSNAHRTGKCQFSFQSQRRAMPQNVQTTFQHCIVVLILHASEIMLNILQARLQHWRRQWHPTPVLLPRKSHGQRSLVGCSPWGRKESDTTERLHFHFYALEKEMATHSSVLAWRIPGTGEPGGLPSMGSHRVRHNWSYLAAAVTFNTMWKNFQMYNLCL